MVFLEAVRRATTRIWATRWDVEAALGGLPLPRDFREHPEVDGVPSKVVLAKFRRVNRRGLVDGCDCGCRGDFELTASGRLALAEHV